MLKFYVIGVRKCICWRLSSGFHDAIRFSHVVKENFEMHPISLCSNFVNLKITADGDCSHEIKTLSHWKKSYDKPRQCIKKQRCHFANKGL